MTKLHAILNALEDDFRAQHRSPACPLWAQLDQLRLAAIRQEART